MGRDRGGAPPARKLRATLSIDAGEVFAEIALAEPDGCLMRL